MSADYAVIDLFAGCGGLTGGFIQAGFRPVAAVENDPSAAATYAANFGAHVAVADLATWSEGSVPRADIVVGGPPCQGFSLLGRRDADDPRNELWRTYVRVVQKVRPAFFVLENVPAFLESPQFAALRDEVTCGSLTGYRLEWFVLDAAEYGVAQRRRRAIVIGRPRGLRPVGRPRPIGRRTLRDVIPPWLPSTPTRMSLPLGEGARRAIPGPFTLSDLHFGRRPSALSLARYRAIPAGGSRLDLPDSLTMRCWRDSPRSANDVLGRLRWDKPAVTMRTQFFKPEKGRFLHPDQPRAITHAEAALIQGFGYESVWCGSGPAIARQIGNAVPPPLASALAQHLRDRLA